MLMLKASSGSREKYLIASGGIADGQWAGSGVSAANVSR
jgi:hypothetical protein